jgi:hypothetical protein
MRRDLRRFMALEAAPFHSLEYLLTARTRSIEVLLRISLDFWRAAATWLDHVAQLPQPVGELRLIDHGRELLTSEEPTFLEGARCAVFAFGEIEHDRMGVELGCSVAINRTGGVVFELGRDKAPGCLRGVIAADPRLRVALQFGERRNT